MHKILKYFLSQKFSFQNTKHMRNRRFRRRSNRRPNRRFDGWTKTPKNRHCAFPKAKNIIHQHHTFQNPPQLEKFYSGSDDQKNKKEQKKKTGLSSSPQNYIKQNLQCKKRLPSHSYLAQVIQAKNYPTTF